MKKGNGFPLLALPGMSLGTLIDVLKRENNQVDKRYWGRLTMLLGLAAVNSLLGHVEKKRDREKILAEELSEPPIFIVGFFRSGTTYLQNLLSLDENTVTPNTYFCLFPNHFHYSKRNGTRILNWLSPRKRPMDDVRFDAQAPYEDEFGLASLSSVSPYFRFLFPEGNDASMMIDPDCYPAELHQKWKDAMCYLVRSVLFWKKGRILLKSPLHAARMKILMELFPGARFIHIVRNPYHVYQSNKKMWEETLSRTHLQVPRPGTVDEIILSWYVELFSLLERGRESVSEDSFVEIHFEDLEKDPISCLGIIYNHFGLSGFDQFEPRVTRYLESLKEYKKNRYELDPAEKEKVGSRWRVVFEKYGYAL